MPPSKIRRLAFVATACAASLAIGAATTPRPLLPGQWRFTNTPTGATLDGRPLKDLPISDVVEETVCLTPAQALDPASWLARDVAADCTLTRRTVLKGRIDIAGTCAPHQGDGLAGTVTLRGQYAPTQYKIRFVTVAHGENGVMGFGGTMAGVRTGECPTADVRNPPKLGRSP